MKAKLRLKDKVASATLKNSLLLFIMLMLAPHLSYGQNVDNISESTVKKSKHLENHGTNAHTFDFGNNNWQFVIVKIKGNYQKDITKKPSQNFEINVSADGNHTNILKKDLYGEETVMLDLKNKADKKMDLKVSAKLISVHGAGKYATGEVEVIAFREGPGIFYVTDIIYDMANVIRLDDEIGDINEQTIDNTKGLSDLITNYKQSFEETKTITWEKTFSHSENISIAAKFNIPVGKIGVEFKANFETSYKNGQAETTSKATEYSTKVAIRPGDRCRIFMRISKGTQKVPYTLKGYTLEEKNGVWRKKLETKSDYCIYTNVNSANIMQDCGSTNDGPKVVKKIL